VCSDSTPDLDLFSAAFKLTNYKYCIEACLFSPCLQAPTLKLMHIE